MLGEKTINAALRVPAHGDSVGRATIDGAVVIYNLDEPPWWLVPILKARDDDGNVQSRRIGWMIPSSPIAGKGHERG